MTDTYLTISEIAANTVFSQRVTACASQQGAPDPPNWTLGHRWQVAATPGFAACGGLLAGRDPDDPENPVPADDPDGWAALPEVISDGMILAAVQPHDHRADPGHHPRRRLHPAGAAGLPPRGRRPRRRRPQSDDELLDLLRDLVDSP